MTREHDSENAARDELTAALPRLLLEGPLDSERLREAAANVEALVLMAEDPNMAVLSRDALLNDISVTTASVDEEVVAVGPPPQLERRSAPTMSGSTRRFISAPG